MAPKRSATQASLNAFFTQPIKRQPSPSTPEHSQSVKVEASDDALATPVKATYLQPKNENASIDVPDLKLPKIEDTPTGISATDSADLRAVSDALLEQFHRITRQPIETARLFLQKSKWVIDAAVELYYAGEAAVESAEAHKALLSSKAPNPRTVIDLTDDATVLTEDESKAKLPSPPVQAASSAPLIAVKAAAPAPIPPQTARVTRAGTFSSLPVATATDSAFNLLMKRPSVTPSNYEIRFNHLKGPALAQAIASLPDWQKLAELKPWYDDSDVTLSYLIEVKKLPLTPKYHSKDMLYNRMKALGFGQRPERPGPRGFCEQTLIHYKARYPGIRDALPDVVQLLASALPLPGSWLAAQVFPTDSTLRTEHTLQSPAGEKFMLAAESFHRPEQTMNGESLVGTGSADLREAMDTACLDAVMEMRNDVASMESLITFVWLRLRLVAPDVKPWKIGENMLDVNPQLRDPAHPWYDCIPSTFWSRAFDKNRPPANQRHASCKIWIVWCSAHDRAESFKVPFAKLLACCGGFYDDETWINLVADSDGRVTNLQMYRQVHGSHLCNLGAQGCVGLRCINYEMAKYNLARRVDHSDAQEHPDDPMECKCYAGIATGKLCYTDRVNRTYQDICNDSLAKLEANLQDDKISKCPLCQEHVTDVRSRKVYISNSTADAFIRHINSAHAGEGYNLRRDFGK